MTTDSITERLNQQADSELKAELATMFQKLWNEINPQGATYPPMTDRMLQLCSNAGFKPRDGDMTCPYIGAIQELYKEIAFAYLAPKRRSKAISDFMAKVEEMDSMLGQLRQDVDNIATA